MKCHKWMMTGAGCLVAAAMAGGLSGVAAAQQREEGRPEQARPAATEDRPSDRDSDADRNGAEQRRRDSDADRSADDRRDRRTFEGERRIEQPQTFQGERRLQGEGTIERGQANGRAALGVFLGPSPTTGARIQAIEPQGAAAQAGIRAGDYILSVNDWKIGRPEDVQQAVAEMAPGAEAEIAIWRNGETQHLTVMLGERRVAGFRGVGGEAFGGRFDGRGADGRNGAGMLGMSLGEAREGEGVRIDNVAPNGPAARAGLRVGDVITTIGMSDVAHPDDLMSALREHQGNDVWFSIVRNGEEHAVKVAKGGQQLSTTAPIREWRGFRGDFTGEAGDPGFGRLMEEHQQMWDRIQRLEAELQSLKGRLGGGAAPGLRGERTDDRNLNQRNDRGNRENRTNRDEGERSDRQPD